MVYVGESEDWVEMIECLHVCRLPVWLSEVRKETCVIPSMEETPNIEQKLRIMGSDPT